MLKLLALTLATLHATPFSAMIFTKGGDPATKLQMTTDGEARITRGREVLVRGPLSGADSSFRIETPEGEICPPVSIELVYDVEQSDRMGAEVTVDFSRVDAQARRACASLAPVAGTYARIE